MQKFRQEISRELEVLRKATRPAAQAGAQIVYDRAREIVASELVSKREHKFYIEGRVYGPFQPGNLLRSIYQAFSKDNSYIDSSTYHISWNADKAPYGAVVEFGGSEEAPTSFIARAVVETRPQVRQAIRQRYIEEVTK